jgi:hypothetical protein
MTSPTCQGQVTAAPSRLLLSTASIAATDCDTIRIPGACYGPQELMTTSPACQGQVTAAPSRLLLSTSTYRYHKPNILEFLTAGYDPQELVTTSPTYQGACHGSNMFPAIVYSTYCWHSLITSELLSMDGLQSTLGVGDNFPDVSGGKSPQQHLACHSVQRVLLATACI